MVQIIEAVFNELKGAFPEVSYHDATTGGHIALDYCVQYQETDFNFVSRLMEQEGISISLSTPRINTRWYLPTLMQPSGNVRARAKCCTAKEASGSARA